MMDRIYFVDNPWPNGHRITKFEWRAHFKYEETGNLEEETGLYFDFHLETADYNEEDTDDDLEEDNEEADDWHAKIVWNNYHSCTLSSEEWSDKGFRVGSDESQFDLASLDGQEFNIDFLSEKEQEELDLDLTAFDVYLLGHDTSAFHTIKFMKVEDQAFQIDWKGKLALVYVGDDKFKYDFHASISSATFSGITIPCDITDEQAYRLLNRFVSNPALFELQSEYGERRFLFKR